MDNNNFWSEESQFGNTPGIVQDLNTLQNNGFLEQNDSADSAVQEKDSEALSSLLMLSKANPEPNAKQNEAEVLANNVEYQNRGGVLPMPSGTAIVNNRVVPASQAQLQQTLQNQQMMKRMAMAPNTERSLRGDSNQPLSKSVKIEDLRRFFHLPIVEVARQLGTCTTALKKICRRNKISKWPYRQIRSITKSIQSLEMASLNDTLNEELRIQYREQIVTLQNAIDDVIRDPNKVVTLVNMGLTEDMVKAAGSGVAAGVLGGGAGGGVAGGAGAGSSGTGSSMMRGQSAVGVGGVLNMMAWPKPSADVQQIMLAASSMTSSSNNNNNNNSSEGNKSRASLGGGGLASGVKRKSDQLGGDDFDPSGHKKQYLDGACSTSSSAGGGYLHPGSELSNDGFDLDVSSPSRGYTNKENSGGLHLNGPPLLGEKGPRGLEGDGVSLNGEDGSNPAGQDMQDNLRHKVVDIGLTVVQCDLNVETQRLQFSGPVHLAPLQRKKLRPNVSRKVVPLMEPDIGSNFSIEFIPQFIVDIVQSSMVLDKGLLEASRLGGMMDGSGGASANAAGSAPVSGGGEGAVVNVNSLSFGSSSAVAAAASSTAPHLDVLNSDHHGPMEHLGMSDDLSLNHPHQYSHIMDVIDSEELDRLINNAGGGVNHGDTLHS